MCSFSRRIESLCAQRRGFPFLPYQPALRPRKRPASRGLFVLQITLPSGACTAARRACLAVLDVQRRESPHTGKASAVLQNEMPACSRQIFFRMKALLYETRHLPLQSSLIYQRRAAENHPGRGVCPRSRRHSIALLFVSCFRIHGCRRYEKRPMAGLTAAMGPDCIKVMGL